ncbi:Protein of unknown function [Gryllus bimaculatus]|nr:Protein of unknown function [Gryllus bimaculatus]
MDTLKSHEDQFRVMSAAIASNQSRGGDDDEDETTDSSDGGGEEESATEGGGEGGEEESATEGGGEGGEESTTEGGGESRLYPICTRWFVDSQLLQNRIKFLQQQFLHEEPSLRNMAKHKYMEIFTLTIHEWNHLLKV